MTLEELNSQILVTPYVELEPHIKRGAVIHVDESLDLAEVALKLSLDDKAAILKFLSEKLLTKASAANFESWKHDKRFFKVLIVQPFVLVQSLAALSEAPPN